MQTILLIGLIMIILDFIYLNLSSDIMKKQIFDVQKSEVSLKIVPVFLCYVVMVLGLYYFIIKDKRPVKDALLLGLLVYSVYELTNMSIFTNWTYKVVIIDILWGTFLFGIVTYLVYSLSNKNINFSEIHPASIHT
jgi:uncharacterized membrane protein